jgi:hypothetical protein
MSYFLSFSSLLRDDIDFDKKEIRKHLVICKTCSKKSLVEKHSVLLFRRMNKIIVKNINNFYFFIKNYDKECLYTKDDLVGECYIIFQKCVAGFNIRKGKDFHWFLNKSLTRGLMRILEKNYLKHLKIERSDYSGVNLKCEIDLDLTKFYSKLYGLTKRERKVLRSKINMVKLKDFLEANPSFTDSEYYKLFNSIKLKMKKLYE